MSGVEIIEAKVVNFEELLTMHIVCSCVVIATLLGFVIITLLEKFKPRYNCPEALVGFLTVMFLIFLSFSALTLYGYTEPYTKYLIKVSDNASFTEVQEKYEILAEADVPNYYWVKDKSNDTD